MGKAENRNKSQKMAADLLARGFYHGKRQSKGLSNVPNTQESGSAAYRRMQQKNKVR